MANLSKKEVIIVLGKNIGIEWNAERIKAEQYHLSPHSRLNVIAAGLLYKRGTTILFSGGRTTLGIPSEAASMRKYFRTFFPRTQQKDLLLENKSFDTISNSQEVKKILQRKAFGKITLLSTSFHVKNAQKVFEKNGIRVNRTISSESVVKRYSKTAKILMKNYGKSKLVIKESRKERIRSLLLNFGNTGLQIIRRGTLLGGRISTS